MCLGKQLGFSQTWLQLEICSSGVYVYRLYKFKGSIYIYIFNIVHMCVYIRSGGRPDLLCADVRTEFFICRPMLCVCAVWPVTSELLATGGPPRIHPYINA